MKKKIIKFKNDYYEIIKVRYTGVGCACEACAFEWWGVPNNCKHIRSLTTERLCGRQWVAEKAEDDIIHAYHKIDPLYRDLLKVKELSDEKEDNKVGRKKNNRRARA